MKPIEAILACCLVIGLAAAPVALAADLEGVIESRPEGRYGKWVVSGQSVAVTESTSFNESASVLEVGGCVKVNFDGEVAGQINSEPAYKCNSSKMGGSGDPYAYVPVLAGLTLLDSGPWNGGIRKKYENASTDFSKTAASFADAMKEAGFTDVEINKGGGWGAYGGRQAWGYKNGHYVKVSAIIGKESWVYVCAWSKPTSSDQCE